jgi:thiamine monophosphate synthase
LTARSLSRMAESIQPRLLALTDTSHADHSVDELSALCHEAAPRTVAVVVRDRALSTQKRYELSRALRQITTLAGQYLFIADRLDLCLAVGGDGLHLPSFGLLPSSVRAHVAWLSRASHAMSQLPPAEIGLLDAMLLSPAFADLKGKRALGEAGLRAQLGWLTQLCDAPVPRGYALGHVDGTNCTRALAAGCVGVACISSVLTAERRSILLRNLAIAH